MKRRYLAGLAVAVVGIVAGCGGGGTGNLSITTGPSTTTASSTVFKVVQTTTLPNGANNGTAATGAFVGSVPQFGTSSAPSVSNTSVSAVPGAPPKPIYVGGAGGSGISDVVVAVAGQTGFFTVPANGTNVVGLDLVTQANATGTQTILFATESNGVLSAPTAMTLIIDPNITVAAGDLRNDNNGINGTSDVADLFGARLENQPAPTGFVFQQVTNTDNNTILTNDGVAGAAVNIKGPIGPFPTGHREIVWDGVPDAFRDNTNFPGAANPANATFPQGFFNRQVGGAKGVQGGIQFSAVNSTDGTTTTNLEVNDEFNTTPTANAAATVANVGKGPSLLPGNALGASAIDIAGNPTGLNLGGDFSNINTAFIGSLLSFSQDASFAPLGTTRTRCTFTVAASTTPGIVHGLGVVFVNVTQPNTASVEYFDINGKSLAKVFAPVSSPGPFPFPVPNVAPGSGQVGFTNPLKTFNYSFAGLVNPNLNIASVVITTGTTPVDSASANGQNAVIMDDVYYSEPQAAPATISQVTVQGTSGPWLFTAGGLNTNFQYGTGDEAAPTVVPVGPGSTVTVTYLSGTASIGSGIAATDANGDTAIIADQGNGVSGEPFPSDFIPAAQDPINVGELIGVFANSSGTIVGTPFKVGDGPVTVTAPAGATQLQLGVVDDIYHDNSGSFTVSVNIQ